jgi:MSHA biogenesis protein MshJ
VNRQLQSITHYLLALSLRERILSLLIILAVVYAVWDAVIFSPQLQYYQQLQTQQQSLLDQQQLQQLSLEENIAKLTADVRSKAELEDKINQTKQQLQHSSQQLNTVLEGLVPPTKITELLHSLLLQTHGLKLIALNNEPVETISLSSENDDKNKKDADASSNTLLYKHSTTMTLSGTYQQLYQYLRTIEQSKWRLYWDKLDYHVTQYPNAEITIRVHTISTDKYWIGL